MSKYPKVHLCLDGVWAMNDDPPDDCDHLIVFGEHDAEIWVPPVFGKVVPLTGVFIELDTLVLEGAESTPELARARAAQIRAWLEPPVLNVNRWDLGTAALEYAELLEAWAGAQEARAVEYQARADAVNRAMSAELEAAAKEDG